MALSTIERFSLLFFTAGILCQSSQAIAPVYITKSGKDLAAISLQLSSTNGNQAPTAGLVSSPDSIPQEPKRPSTVLSRSSRPAAPKTAKAAVLEAVFIPESPDSWYFEWAIKIHGPLFFEQATLEAFADKFAQELEEGSLHFLLESPVSTRLGYFQLRSHLPLQWLWQDKESSDWPLEMQRDYDSSGDERRLLAAAYRSGLYLHWALPRLFHRRHSTTSENLNNLAIGAHIQLGSIKPRNSSPWYTLRSSSLFPGSSDAIRSLGPARQSDGLQSAISMYDNSTGLGQNFGLSFESPYLYALVLRQRSTREEHFSYGLGLRFDHSSLDHNSNHGSSTQEAGTKTSYPRQQLRLQLAALLSQNLSPADSSRSRTGDWYWEQRQVRQNEGLYEADAFNRWFELLRLDSTLKQYYLHGSWKHRFAGKQLRRYPAYLQLSSEQSLSHSPLDFLGLMQKYYAKFALPPRQISKTERSKPSAKLGFDSEFLASYYDAHWMDARRRLARSTLGQRYRERLGLHNKSRIYLQVYNKDEQADINRLPEAPAKPRLVPRFFLWRSDHILQFNTRLQIAQVLQPQPSPYLHLDMTYYLLSHRRPALDWQADSRWHWSLRAMLEQQMPTFEITYHLTALPTPLWRRKFRLRFGWQQQPPSRLAQAKARETRSSQPPDFKSSQNFQSFKVAQNTVQSSVLRFGWSAELQSSEENLTDAQLGQVWQRYSNDLAELSHLEAESSFSLFLQQWKFGSHQNGRQSKREGWWKFFQLRLQLGLVFQFPKSSPLSLLRLGLKAKIQAEMQLAYNWQFLFGVDLDDWELALNHRSQPLQLEQLQPLNEALAIQLSLRYQFRRTGRNSNSQGRKKTAEPEEQTEQPELEKTVEELEQNYSWQDPEESDSSEEISL